MRRCAVEDRAEISIREGAVGEFTRISLYPGDVKALGACIFRPPRASVPAAARRPRAGEHITQVPGHADARPLARHLIPHRPHCRRSAELVAVRPGGPLGVEPRPRQAEHPRQSFPRLEARQRRPQGRSGARLRRTGGGAKSPATWSNGSPSDGRARSPDRSGRAARGRSSASRRPPGRRAQPSPGRRHRSRRPLGAPPRHRRESLRGPRRLQAVVPQRGSIHPGPLVSCARGSPDRR